MPGTAREKALLLRLQGQAIQYFLENQSHKTGLVLDRQRNFGPLAGAGLYSTAATGMGLIAVALASAPPYRLIARHEAVARIRRALETAYHSVPHTHGVLPHFLDSGSGAVVGADARSTVDTAWLIAGGLWAAAFLRESILDHWSAKLYERVDWRAWTAPGALLRHSADSKGRLLPCCWDRLNGETVFMYVLAAGAEANRAWPAAGWGRLRAFRGERAGLRFGSADLGLFVFQYGLDLLDLGAWRLPGGFDLMADAALATEANARVCQDAADHFATYRRFWGLSAGDGPGEPPARDSYRSYSPAEPLDGTAHISATLASLVHRPALVWENIFQATAEPALPPLGRYGFSNINLDRSWVSRDMVGIDAGSIVLALDNYLFNDRVRKAFDAVECVRLGLDRIGAIPAAMPKRIAA